MLAPRAGETDLHGKQDGAVLSPQLAAAIHLASAAANRSPHLHGEIAMCGYLVSTGRGGLALCLALALLFSPCGAEAQSTTAPDGEHDDRMAWWREARFGLFIHWGLYSIPAGQWRNQTHHGEWIMHSAQIPVDEYEQFLDEFNPEGFDAVQWTRLARDAGMRYLVITCKHHDGFCLFDSKLTEYDIMSTPFGRDIMRELSDACRENGLAIGCYHSIMDWHHPDYLPRREWEVRSAEGADFDRYVKHLHDQVRELMTSYGPIDIMWFDGEWESTWTHDHGVSLFDLCRSLRPETIINNRVDKGRAGMAGMTIGGEFKGDFGTPEQEVPATGHPPGIDWESCMTMNDHWGYNQFDHHWKSSTQLIRTLVDVASKGGNFLLNVGPMADGSFPQPCIDRLREIGAWMDVHGESIHGTQASPFGALPWGRCTMKQGADSTTLFLHVFNWPESGEIIVPGLANEFASAMLMCSSTPLAVRRNESDLHVELRHPGARAGCGDPHDEHCPVVALVVDGEAAVHHPPRIDAPSSVFVKPLQVEITSPIADAAIRYTLDGTDPTTASPAYEKPIEIGETISVRARVFRGGRALSPIASAQFTRATPCPARDSDAIEPGLVLETWSGRWNALPDFDSLPAHSREIVHEITLPSKHQVENAGHRFRGLLRVPDDDVYRFELVSDDGARLWINGELVVDHDGLHAAELKSGSAALARGWHDIEIEHFNRNGDVALELRMGTAQGPGVPPPPESLAHDR